MVVLNYYLHIIVPCQENTKRVFTSLMSFVFYSIQYFYFFCLTRDSNRKHKSCIYYSSFYTVKLQS